MEIRPCNAINVWDIPSCRFNWKSMNFICKLHCSCLILETSKSQNCSVTANPEVAKKKQLLIVSCRGNRTGPSLPQQRLLLMSGFSLRDTTNSRSAARQSHCWCSPREEQLDNNCGDRWTDTNTEKMWVSDKGISLSEIIWCVSSKTTSPFF